jgi:DNA replication and repair protein RecF
MTAGGSPAPLVVITGPNGAGKTNILEAISLLTPGRGLRGADSRDLMRRGGDGLEGWAVAGDVSRGDGLVTRLGSGYDPRTDRRRIRVDGREAKASTAFAPHFSALWLTPQMDGLFIEGAAARRRFLDRLVAAYAPDHATRLNRYERLQRERMAQLQAAARPDDRWLTPVEEQLAGEAVAIAAARLVVTERLQHHAQRLGDIQKLFPAPVIALQGVTEESLQTRPAVEVEAEYAQRLRAARGEDAATGRTAMGVHRSDMAVSHAAKNMPAAEASTGEQKALLIALTLAHAQMMRSEKGFVPVLLLDEVAAHLDDQRRLQLFSFLHALSAQVFVTGTEPGVFAGIGDALHVAVMPGPGGIARVQAGHVNAAEGGGWG